MSIWEYVVNVVSWLLAHSGGVIWWIKYYAREVADTVVGSAISHAYSVVKKWIDARYWNVRNWATPLINNVKALAFPAWSWVQTAYGTVSAWIKVKIDPIWAAIGDWVHDLYLSIVEWSVKTYNKVVVWATPTIDWIKDQVKVVQEWVADVFVPVEEQIELFSTDTKEKFTALFDDGWVNISGFLFDPLNTILAMITPIFIDIFCYAAAYALGTEKYSLPPWPKWDDLVIDGNGRPPSPTPSGLTPPLAKMWVSGYRFTR
ncbi:unnamed protein product, partial [marine sediment metagenome]